MNYASRQVTAIEINGTFYRLQKPAVFAKWRDDAPEDFVFAIKAPRYLTYRKVLSEANDSIPRFLGSGLSELQHKLGPILWQLPPSLHFDADDIAKFLEVLPAHARRPASAPRAGSAPQKFHGAGIRRISRRNIPSRRCSRTPTNSLTSPTSPQISSMRD